MASEEKIAAIRAQKKTANYKCFGAFPACLHNCIVPPAKQVSQSIAQYYTFKTLVLDREQPGQRYQKIQELVPCRATAIADRIPLRHPADRRSALLCRQPGGLLRSRKARLTNVGEDVHGSVFDNA